jgi:hypothetical protein
MRINPLLLGRALWQRGGGAYQGRRQRPISAAFVEARAPWDAVAPGDRPHGWQLP